MPGKSDYYENAVLNTLRNVSLVVANVYVALFTTLPDDDGTGGVEVSGGSYVRLAVTFNAPSSGSMTNNGALTFAQATATWGDVVGFGLFDALTVGNLLYFNYLSATTRRPFVGYTDDTLESPAHGYSDNDRVVVSAEAGGVLPTGLSDSTIYHVVSAATDTFKVSLSQGGAAVDITADGTGFVKLVVIKNITAPDQFEFSDGQLTVAEK